MKSIKFLGFTLKYATRENNNRLEFIGKSRNGATKNWHQFTSRYNYMTCYEADAIPMRFELNVPSDVQGEFRKNVYNCRFLQYEFEACSIHALESKAQKAMKEQLLKQESDIAELKKLFQI